MNRFAPPLDREQFRKRLALCKADCHKARGWFGVCLSEAETRADLMEIRDAVTECLRALETAEDQARIRIESMNLKRFIAGAKGESV